MQLQTRVFDALTSALNVPVVKYVNEYDGDYPAVVFRELSNTPAFFGDNVELLRRVTYQISIGTSDDNFAALESAVDSAMRGLGFSRVESYETFEDVFWREIKFSILTGVD